MIFYLSLIYLDFDPIGLDEPFSIFNAQFSVTEIINNLRGGNNPPLYEILLHYWIRIFGISPLSVRLPSLFLSLSTIFVGFMLVSSNISKRAAFATAFLLIFSNYFNWFTHEARVYSLFTFLTLSNTFLTFQYSKLKKNRILIALFLVNLGLLYSHYLAIYVFFSQLFLGSILLRRSEVFAKYITSVSLAFVLFVPYLIEFVKQLKLTYREKMWAATVENLGQFHDVLFFSMNKNVAAYALVILAIYAFAIYHIASILKMKLWLKCTLLTPLIVLCVASLSIFIPMPFVWRLTENQLFTIVFFVIWMCVILLLLIHNRSFTLESYVASFLGVTLFLFFALSLELTIYVDRYLIFVVPFIYIQIALLFLRRVNIVSVSSLLVLCFMMLSSFQFRAKNHEPIDEIVTFIKKEKQDSTAIFIWPKYYDLNFMYHYDRQAFSDYTGFETRKKRLDIYSVWNEYEAELYFDQKYKTVLFLDMQGDEKKNIPLQKLLTSYNGILIKKYKPNARIYRITRP